MGLRRFRLAFTCWSYSGTGSALSPVAYGTITRYGRSFQNVPLGLLCNFTNRPYNPAWTKSLRFRLIPRSLAATDGVAFAFFSWGY